MVNSSSLDSTDANRNGKTRCCTQAGDGDIGSQSLDADDTAFNSGRSKSAAAAADNLAGVDETAIGPAEINSSLPTEASQRNELSASLPSEKPKSASPDEDKSKQQSRKLLCLYCDRSFGSANLRQKHVERVHSVKSTRRVSARRQNQLSVTPCSYCDKLNETEHTLNDLFQHMIQEHSLKYFGCLSCEERFLSSVHLVDHNKSKHLKKGPSPDLPLNLLTDDAENGPQKVTRSKLRHKTEETLAVEDVTKQRKKSKLKELRNKKISVKTSKIALKRSKRLQQQAKEHELQKKRRERKLPSNRQEASASAKQPEKGKSVCINPYPEFDNFYRVKKITDHSIDNLKISSLTFDDVFDKAFFNRIKCNIEENLQHHIDGKLFKNEESESRISNFEKISSVAQEVQNTSADSYGCELSLNAITPVPSLSLTSQFGEDFESQIEYGSKPSKKKNQINSDEVHYKYFTRRKYQASILLQKENRDLSKLDMWTQMLVKERQERVINKKKSAKEIQEYTCGQEYKSKIKRQELNRILDRRGPFEDLKQEASKKAAFDKLNSSSDSGISPEVFSDVREVLNDLLDKVFETVKEDDLPPENSSKEIDQREIPAFLHLRRKTSSTQEEFDRSDRIALICSSQETENFELPSNTVRGKNELIELTGEWARSRLYICAACGGKFSNMKYLLEHKSLYHQNVWVQHYEFVGNQGELYRHLSIPGLGKVGIVEDTVPCKQWRRSAARICTKCGKQCNALGELHRHMLECGGDWTWMLARKKCRYKPFGAKSRRKRRGFEPKIQTRRKTEPSEKKIYKKPMDGPRQRPSDADTIQRMLANLPAKRSRRSLISLTDVVFKSRKTKNRTNSVQSLSTSKTKCGKAIHKKKQPDSGKVKSNQQLTKRALRSLNKVLSSRILDLNSSLLVKRKMKTLRSQRLTRDAKKLKINYSGATSDEQTADDILLESDDVALQLQKKRNLPRKDTEEEVDIPSSKNVVVNKTRSVSKRLLSSRLNLKNFFPVKKKNVRLPDKRLDVENVNDLDLVDGENSKPIDTYQHMKKNKKGGLKGFVRALSLRKRDSKQEEYLPVNNKSAPELEKVDNSKKPSRTKVKQTSKEEPVDSAPVEEPTSTLLSKKRKFQRSFRNVFKKIKTEKQPPPIKAEYIEKKSSSSPVQSQDGPFLEGTSPKKETISTEKVASPAEVIENMLEKEDIVPIVAKTAIESVTEQKEEGQNKDNTDLIVPNHPVSNPTENLSTFVELDCNKTTPVAIDTSLTPKCVPLISPNIKGKIRKPSRGLNDCIAMLTSKLQHKDDKTSSSLESLFSTSSTTSTEIKPLSDLLIKLPKPDSIPKLSTFVVSPTTAIEETALDLSKKSVSTPNLVFESPFNSNKVENWTSVDDIIQQVVQNSAESIFSTPKRDRLLRNNVDDTIDFVVTNSLDWFDNKNRSEEKTHKKIKRKRHSDDNLITNILFGKDKLIIAPSSNAVSDYEDPLIARIKENEYKQSLLASSSNAGVPDVPCLLEAVYKIDAPFIATLTHSISETGTVDNIALEKEKVAPTSDLDSTQNENSLLDKLPDATYNLEQPKKMASRRRGNARKSKLKVIETNLDDCMNVLEVASDPLEKLSLNVSGASETNIEITIENEPTVLENKALEPINNKLSNETERVNLPAVEAKTGDFDQAVAPLEKGLSELANNAKDMVETLTTDSLKENVEEISGKSDQLNTSTTLNVIKAIRKKKGKKLLVKNKKRIQTHKKSSMEQDTNLVENSFTPVSPLPETAVLTITDSNSVVKPSEDINTTDKLPVANAPQRTRRKSKSSKKIGKINNDLFKDFSLVINKKTKRIPPTSIVDDSVCDDINFFVKPTSPNNKEVESPTLNDSVEEMDMEIEDIPISTSIIERDASYKEAIFVSDTFNSVAEEDKESLVTRKSPRKKNGLSDVTDASLIVKPELQITKKVRKSKKDVKETSALPIDEPELLLASEPSADIISSKEIERALSREIPEEIEINSEEIPLKPLNITADFNSIKNKGNLQTAIPTPDIITNLQLENKAPKLSLEDVNREKHTENDLLPQQTTATQVMNTENDFDKTSRVETASKQIRSKRVRKTINKNVLNSAEHYLKSNLEDEENRKIRRSRRSKTSIKINDLLFSPVNSSDDSANVQSTSDSETKSSDYGFKEPVAAMVFRRTSRRNQKTGDGMGADDSDSNENLLKSSSLEEDKLESNEDHYFKLIPEPASKESNFVPKIGEIELSAEQDHLDSSSVDYLATNQEKHIDVAKNDITPTKDMLKNIVISNEEDEILIGSSEVQIVCSKSALEDFAEKPKKKKSVKKRLNNCTTELPAESTEGQCSNLKLDNVKNLQAKLDKDLIQAEPKMGASSSPEMHYLEQSSFEQMPISNSIEKNTNDLFMMISNNSTNIENLDNLDLVRKRSGAAKTKKSNTSDPTENTDNVDTLESKKTPKSKTSSKLLRNSTNRVQPSHSVAMEKPENVNIFHHGLLIKSKRARKVIDYNEDNLEKRAMEGKTIEETKDVTQLPKKIKKVKKTEVFNKQSNENINVLEDLLVKPQNNVSLDINVTNKPSEPTNNDKLCDPFTENTVIADNIEILAITYKASDFSEIPKLVVDIHHEVQMDDKLKEHNLSMISQSASLESPLVDVQTIIDDEPPVADIDSTDIMAETDLFNDKGSQKIKRPKKQNKEMDKFIEDAKVEDFIAAVTTEDVATTVENVVEESVEYFTKSDARSRKAINYNEVQVDDNLKEHNLSVISQSASLESSKSPLVDLQDIIDDGPSIADIDSTDIVAETDLLNDKNSQKIKRPRKQNKGKDKFVEDAKIEDFIGAVATEGMVTAAEKVVDESVEFLTRSNRRSRNTINYNEVQIDDKLKKHNILVISQSASLESSKSPLVDDDDDEPLVVDIDSTDLMAETDLLNEGVFQKMKRPRKQSKGKDKFVEDAKVEDFIETVTTEDMATTVEKIFDESAESFTRFNRRSRKTINYNEVQIDDKLNEHNISMISRAANLASPKSPLLIVQDDEPPVVDIDSIDIVTEADLLNDKGSQKIKRPRKQSRGKDKFVEDANVEDFIGAVATEGMATTVENIVDESVESLTRSNRRSKKTINYNEVQIDDKLKEHNVSMISQSANLASPKSPLLNVQDDEPPVADIDSIDIVTEADLLNDKGSQKIKRPRKQSRGKDKFVEDANVEDLIGAVATEDMTTIVENIVDESVESFTRSNRRSRKTINYNEVQIDDQLKEHNLSMISQYANLASPKSPLLNVEDDEPPVADIDSIDIVTEADLLNEKGSQKIKRPTKQSRGKDKFVEDANVEDFIGDVATEDMATTVENIVDESVESFTRSNRRSRKTINYNEIQIDDKLREHNLSRISQSANLPSPKSPLLNVEDDEPPVADIDSIDTVAEADLLNDKGSQKIKRPRKQSKGTDKFVEDANVEYFIGAVATEDMATTVENVVDESVESFTRSNRRSRKTVNYNEVQFDDKLKEHNFSIISQSTDLASSKSPLLNAHDDEPPVADIDSIDIGAEADLLNDKGSQKIKRPRKQSKGKNKFVENANVEDFIRAVATEDMATTVENIVDESVESFTRYNRRSRKTINYNEVQIDDKFKEHNFSMISQSENLASPKSPLLNVQDDEPPVADINSIDIVAEADLLNDEGSQKIKRPRKQSKGKDKFVEDENVEDFIGVVATEDMATTVENIIDESVESFTRSNKRSIKTINYNEVQIDDKLKEHNLSMVSQSAKMASPKSPLLDVQAIIDDEPSVAGTDLTYIVAEENLLNEKGSHKVKRPRKPNKGTDKFVEDAKVEDFIGAIAAEAMVTAAEKVVDESVETFTRSNRRSRKTINYHKVQVDDKLKEHNLIMISQSTCLESPKSPLVDVQAIIAEERPVADIDSTDILAATDLLNEKGSQKIKRPKKQNNEMDKFLEDVKVEDFIGTVATEDMATTVEKVLDECVESSTRSNRRYRKTINYNENVLLNTVDSLSSRNVSEKKSKRKQEISLSRSDGRVGIAEDIVSAPMEVANPCIIQNDNSKPLSKIKLDVSSSVPSEKPTKDIFDFDESISNESEDPKSFKDFSKNKKSLKQADTAAILEDVKNIMKEGLTPELSDLSCLETPQKFATKKKEKKPKKNNMDIDIANILDLDFDNQNRRSPRKRKTLSNKIEPENEISDNAEAVESEYKIEDHKDTSHNNQLLLQNEWVPNNISDNLQHTADSTKEISPSKPISNAAEPLFRDLNNVSPVETNGMEDVVLETKALPEKPRKTKKDTSSNVATNGLLEQNDLLEEKCDEPERENQLSQINIKDLLLSSVAPPDSVYNSQLFVDSNASVSTEHIPKNEAFESTIKPTKLQRKKVKSKKVNRENDFQATISGVQENAISKPKNKSSFCKNLAFTAIKNVLSSFTKGNKGKKSSHTMFPEITPLTEIISSSELDIAPVLDEIDKSLESEDIYDFNDEGTDEDKPKQSKSKNKNKSKLSFKDAEISKKRTSNRTAKQKALESIHEKALNDLQDLELQSEPQVRKNRKQSKSITTFEEIATDPEPTIVPEKNNIDKVSLLAFEAEVANILNASTAQYQSDLLNDLEVINNSVSHITNKEPAEVVSNQTNAAELEPSTEKPEFDGDGIELRRSSRGTRKIASYNENDLIDPLIDALETRRTKNRRDKSTENPPIKKDISKENPKLSSDELFDLLKNSSYIDTPVSKPLKSFFDNLNDAVPTSNDESSNSAQVEKDGNKIYEFTEDSPENTELFGKNKKAKNVVEVNDVEDNNSLIHLNDKKQTKEPEKSNYCDICKRSFIRMENLIKHKTTLTHISKLSELEAREAEEKARLEKQAAAESREETKINDILQTSEQCRETIETTSSPLPNNHSLKLVDIISDVLNKPVIERYIPNNQDYSASELIDKTTTDFRRYKSLGERKSFESESHLAQINAPYIPPAMSQTTILENQINLLENIIGNNIAANQRESENNFIDDISSCSNHSNISLDNNSSVFNGNSENVEVNIEEADFVKPTQYEEISEDSASARVYEDPKQRKTLNRDEELFLECCSLLKSGSEVSNSNYSKKPKKTIDGLKQLNEPEIMESKNLIQTAEEAHEYSDNSRTPTPLGDTYDDEASNSNTISSNWHLKSEKPLDKNHSLSFEEVKNKEAAGMSFGEILTKGLKNQFENISKVNDRSSDSFREQLPEPYLSNDDRKDDSNGSTASKKVATKGARKVYEGLKVSIPTEDLNLDVVLTTNFVNKKQDLSKTIPTSDESIEKGPSKSRSTRKSKPVKKSQIGSNLLFKVNKKKSSNQMNNLTPQEDPDIYNFDETQDNTDVFIKPTFKGIKIATPDSKKNIVAMSDNESLGYADSIGADAKSVSSVSSIFSAVSVNKQEIAPENITKKKYKIMGKIFKNAAKSRIDDTDEELRSIAEIPEIDNLELVENYVRSCQNIKSSFLPPPQPAPFEEVAKKPKMTEEEINMLFDQLLGDKPVEEVVHSKAKNCDNNKKKNGKVKPRKRARLDSSFNSEDNLDNNFDDLKVPQLTSEVSKKAAHEQVNSTFFDEMLDKKVAVEETPVAKHSKSKTDVKHCDKKKTSRVKSKKRARGNSESSGDEFNIGRSAKRSNKKNNQDDSGINLELELKECIGVASRKSQRTCTSGKQNILVEYWSSDEEAFEAMLESNKIIAKKENAKPEVVVESRKPDLFEKPLSKHRPVNKKRTPSVKKPKVPAQNAIALATSNRRKRAAANPLYHWSSSSEDESQSLIEVKPIREEDDEDDRPVQHGWIVGDSPKKLVTMLALTKGKKTDFDSVKEQGKRRTSNTTS